MAAPLAMVGSALGSIVSAFGSYQGGKAGQAMSNYQARVAQINAGIAQEQADAETVAGEQRAQVSGIQTAQRVGGIRAGIGAGNLDIGSGSGRNVIASQEEVGQFEQGQIRNEAGRRRYGSEVTAFSDTAQANLDITAGKQLATAGDIGAASSILGGATSVSDKWTKYTEAFGSGSGSTSDSALVGAV